VSVRQVVYGAVYVSTFVIMITFLATIIALVTGFSFERLVFEIWPYGGIASAVLVSAFVLGHFFPSLR
jgi:hypothetical protein